MSPKMIVYSFVSNVMVNIFLTNSNQITVYIKSEVFMAAIMKNAVFWDVAQCGSCKNQCSHSVTS
jgi:hypothetical protein